jgi:molecular chaperone DnaJ
LAYGLIHFGDGNSLLYQFNFSILLEMDIGVDYYKVLEIDQSTSTQEVRRLYRKILDKCQQEKTQPSREVRFAFEILSHPEKRAEYDTLRKARDEDVIYLDENVLFQKMGMINQVYDQTPETGKHTKMLRGKDIVVEVPITLTEAYQGGQKELNVEVKYPCRTCAIECVRCKGTGKIMAFKAVLGEYKQKIETPCNPCKSVGYTFRDNYKLCAECKGASCLVQTKRLFFKIHPGIETDTTHTLARYGEQVIRGIPGDLIIKIKVNSEDPRIERAGDNLRIRLEIPFIKTITGAKYSLSLPNGEMVEIDTLKCFNEVLNPFKLYVLSEKGMPVYDPVSKSVIGYGNAIVQFVVDYPKYPENLKDLQSIEDQFNNVFGNPGLDR